jgi:hypothetical protein
VNPLLQDVIVNFKADASYQNRKYPDGTSVVQTPDAFYLGALGDTVIFSYKDAAGKPTSTVQRHSIPADQDQNPAVAPAPDCPACPDLACPAAVGGEAGLLGGAAARAEAATGSGGAPLAPIAAAVAAGVAVLAAGGWYARRRWMR